MVGHLLGSEWSENVKLKKLVFIIFLSLMAALIVSHVNAQTATPIVPCKIGHEAPPIGFWTWATNAHVKVFIVSADFQPAHIPYLLTALDSWTKVSALTGSGVQFEYQGSTEQQHLCENCLTVMRGPVFDKAKRHATELRAFSARGDQIITYATIVIDPRLTNPKALLNAMVHELGHNLGLLDCYTCKRKSTVMNQLAALNVPNGMQEPTSCDVARVKEAYEELKVRIRPSPTNGSATSDVGEEPVDDDTPIVVPKTTMRSGISPPVD